MNGRRSTRATIINHLSSFSKGREITPKIAITRQPKEMEPNPNQWRKAIHSVSCVLQAISQWTASGGRYVYI